MPLASIRYRFRQSLPASLEEAYRWCTDFRDDDSRYFPPGLRRRVKWLAPDTLTQEDRRKDGRRTVRKLRLIRLLPEQRSWSNTHLEGPNRFSQFFYRLRPKGPRRCVLEFTALHLERTARSLTDAERRRRARELARQDRAVWRRFARAIAAERADAPPRSSRRLGKPTR